MALRLALLLVMLAGTQGARADDNFETGNSYYLASGSDVGKKGGVWVSEIPSRYAVTDDADNTYVAVGTDDNGGNGTRVYTESTANLVAAGVSFILQFDIKLAGGSNQPSWFQVNDARNIAVQTGGGAGNTTASSILQLAQKAAGGNEWVVNGNEGQTITLDKDKWYRFWLLRTYDKTYLKVLEGTSDKVDGSSVVYFNEAEITTHSTVGGLGRMEFATKRYNSSMTIKNLAVQRWGWSVAEYSAALTDGNNDNKMTTGIPKLYNPGSPSPEVTYDGTVLGNCDKTYPPRMKAAGDGTVTAVIGGKKSVYTYHVTVAAGGGTYDAAAKTYTFDRVGQVRSRTVTDVPGITMSSNGGPVAIVVERDGTKYLKVIDAYGYSHPNLDNGGTTIPPEHNWGGTFYKFVPSVAGQLTINGKMDYAKLYESDGTTLKADGTEMAGIELEVGKTYYLYNAGSDSKGSNVPLLHSFKYEPNATSLTFRNPEAVITVDQNDGSFFNPAISATGHPVTYSIIAGGAYASVSADGLVTFTKNLSEPSYTVTVKAEAGSEAVSYTLNLVRRTWIFNDKDKWSTTGSELTSWTDGTHSGDGLASAECYNTTTTYNFEELKKNGSDLIPETRGLLFSKNNNAHRLYLAPKDCAENFLAMRATGIAIDDVKEGQVVTVNWRGGNGSAVLDMADASGENVTGYRGGTLTMTVKQTGRVTIYANAVISYINSIAISTPQRAIGTLNYSKTVLQAPTTDSEGNTTYYSQLLTGYTITDESGTADLKSAYGSLTNFQSSNESVATVDASGQVTAMDVGTAVITATATAKNSTTHQAGVTLVATIEVVGDAATRIRTINIEDLKYRVGTDGVNANSGLNRRIPGFDLTFEGGDGVKCNNTGSLLFRYSTGQMTITPRLARSDDKVYITQALLTVKSAASGATFTVNGTPKTATEEGMTLSTSDVGDKKESLVIKSTSSDAFEITAIKLYYKCSNSDAADYCLNETKIAPDVTFSDEHILRVPGDGRAFEPVPTLTVGDYFKSFDINYTYRSSIPSVATINGDGTNGQLVASGESVITATYAETTYFAAATASYSVSNTMLPGETYNDIDILANQRIHIHASASVDGTQLALSGSDGATPNMSELTFGTTNTRQNTYSMTAGKINLKNNTTHQITLYSVEVVTSNLRQWLYYEGQKENYKEQVQYKGFTTGPVKGFMVVDVGNPYNPIDLSDAYELDGNYSITSGSSITSIDASTGNATAEAVGTSVISHQLKKTGQADGYADVLTATSTVQVLDFGTANEVVWDFYHNNVPAKAENLLGYGWSYEDRTDEGFHYGYFEDYTPITQNDGAVYTGMHGMLLKDEFRWYCKNGEADSRGLRANLSQARSSIKFPVKAGMEVEVYAASSSADIGHVINNVTDLNGNPTNTLLIETAGYNNPVRRYFLAKEDGCVEIKSTDKVGLYLKTITLRVPKIHFEDEIVVQLPTGDDGANHITNTATNIPPKSLKYLSYTISSPKNFDDESVAASTLADIDNISESATQGRLTTKGAEGWFQVDVENTNPLPGPLEPKSGSYMVYLVDFKFDPAKATLNLNAHNGEDYYGGDNVNTNQYPVGKDKVPTPINYSFSIPDGSTAKAMIHQTTHTDPSQTTYQLTAYSSGTVNLYATTGRITAQCALTVNGYAFADVAPVLSDKDIEENDGVFYNKLPAGFTVEDALNTGYQADLSGGMTEHPSYAIVEYDGGLAVEISNLAGKGHGAIRFTAKKSDDESQKIQFVLTLAYPASSGHKWDFFRQKDGLNALKNHSNKVADYTAYGIKQENIPLTITGTNTWTTDTKWTKVYRNGQKEPRWAYDNTMRRDNAFVIEETAGLQIEAPSGGFYIDNNTTAAYTHIGQHSRSTLTIPRLKDGDFIRLSLSRVIPNNGAIIEAKNVTDLADTPVTENFTITRAQIDYRENGELATESDGTRIIPGYYTFKAKAQGEDAGKTEFDVSFTLADEGYLDILSVEIYDKTTPVNYLDTKAQDGYQHTMRAVRLDDEVFSLPPTQLLKESSQQQVYNLTYCHPLWSVSASPSEYDLVERTRNLQAEMENVGWYSAGGAYYNSGRITVNNGYGRIKLRMNNYTAEGKYLIGYTPDYTLTVGHLPHQDYPYTWDFTRISGGRSKGRSNSVYASVYHDDETWTNVDDNTFTLKTDGGSLYVPGATMVTDERDLGMSGEADYLDSHDYARDEFNGLGVSGQVMMQTESQTASARSDAPRKTSVDIGSIDLLYYRMDNPNYDIKKPLLAGNGFVEFGADKREAVNTNRSSCGYGYKLDGDIASDKKSTKYALLTPLRPFQSGDVIKIKAFCTSTPSDEKKYGLSLFLENVAGGTTALETKYIPSGSKDREVELTFTVSDDSKLIGKSSVYVFRAAGYSTYINEITITGSYSVEVTKKSLKAVTPTVITVPDVNAGGKQDWIYVKADRKPFSVSNATEVTDDASGGADQNEGVYKYKVTAPGKCDITFAGGTTIEKIGVTHILKQMTPINGKAWATESREHAIDHALTGYFTLNDVNAYAVRVKEYAYDKAQTAVSLNAISEDGYVPENTGLVLKLEGTDNLAKANGGNSVPLFYPSMTAAQTPTAIDFPANNMMRPNTATAHPDDGTYDESGGIKLNSENEQVDDVDYYRFVLAKQYATWKKVDGGDVVAPTEFEERDAAVFYRLHIFDDGFDSQSTGVLNTLGPNKAYLLLPADKINDALWQKDEPSPAREFIGIEGESEAWLTDAAGDGRSVGDGRTYNLRGQAVSAEGKLPRGIYIRDGKKYVED